MNKEKEKEKEKKKKEEEESKNKSVEKDPKERGILPRWVHWFVSSALLFGSSFAFYYLFRNRNKFLIKKI